MNLFSPIKLGKYNLKNRIFMAPMTRCRAKKDNTPTDIMLEYYSQRASAGLIITEGTQISPRGVGYVFTPGIYKDSHIKGWKKITNAVHEKEGVIFVQLWHEGRVSHSSYHDGKPPLAPSRVKINGQIYTYEGMQDYELPKKMSVEEIQETKEEYVKAAKNAMKAGFDGVEVHSANGYLLDQFLRDGTNSRSDEYGGNIEKRARFLFEVVEAVCSAIGSDKVGVRLSPSGTMNDMSDSNPQKHFAYVCQKLNDFNLAYVHIVDALEGDIRHGANVVDLAILRDAYKGTLITNGGYDKTKGNMVLENHLANAVSFAKLFLANPDLPERFKKNRKLNEPDKDTFYTHDEKGYTDYPTL